MSAKTLAGSEKLGNSAILATACLENSKLATSNVEDSCSWNASEMSLMKLDHADLAAEEISSLVDLRQTSVYQATFRVDNALIEPPSCQVRLLLVH